MNSNGECEQPAGETQRLASTIMERTRSRAEVDAVADASKGVGKLTKSYSNLGEARKSNTLISEPRLASCRLQPESLETYGYKVRVILSQPRYNLSPTRTMRPLPTTTKTCIMDYGSTLPMERLQRWVMHTACDMVIKMKLTNQS